MTTEEKLKALILSRYPSVTAFSDTCGVPYQTINSILKRGIKNAGISNIIDICSCLGLSVEDLYSGEFVYQKQKAVETPIEELLSILEIQLEEGNLTFDGSLLTHDEAAEVKTALHYITYLLHLKRAKK